MTRNELALNLIADLEGATNGARVAYYLGAHSDAAADIHLNSALKRIESVNLTIAKYHNAPTLPGAGNPHHSGYLADDETRPTMCPHCGNEDYDSETRCQRCGLWDLDDHHAKRFRFLELINGMDIDDLNTAFSAVIESVVM